MENVVASSKKGCPYKAGMNRLKSYKSSNLLLWKIILLKSFPTTATGFFQLWTYATTGEVSHQNLLTIRIQCSTLSKLNNISLCRKRCAATIKPKSLLMILQSLKFILFCIQKMILYQNVARTSKKTVSFDDIVHIIDEANIVAYEDLDCGITVYSETATKIRQINRERNYIWRSCEEPKCIPRNGQHNCFIDEQYNSDIFLKPYNFWDMVPAALMSINHTKNRYSMSHKYPQPTTHQPRKHSYPVFSPLQRDGQPKEGIPRQLCILSTQIPTRRTMNETVATVEELSDLCKPGAMEGIPPFVMNCNCI